MAGPDLASFLAGVTPFDALDPDDLAAVVAAARVEDLRAGDVATTGLRKAASDVYVVVRGEVDVWDDVERSGGPPDSRVGVGGLFSPAAVLSGPSLGPYAVAVGEATVVAVPAPLLAPALASRRGAAFVAEHVSSARRRAAVGARYSRVDDLVVTPPVVVTAETPLAEVARRMTAGGVGCAAVALPGGGHGLVTDELLRRRVLVEGRPASTPAGAVVSGVAPTAVTGESADEALLRLLEAGTDHLLVTDPAGVVRGVVEPRDFLVSPAAAGVTLQEQVRRAETAEDLVTYTAGLPPLLADLLARGMGPEKVVAVHSAALDTTVRRALTLVFADRPGLSPDAFTWLSLGSNGRREAVPSSDVESAVVFGGDVDPEEFPAYREAFAAVHDLLAACGFTVDDHGATASSAGFARTAGAWRTALDSWRLTPEAPHHAAMLSLLLDSRPVHGDAGRLPLAALVRDLRADERAMRLLLQESLSHRSRVRSLRDVFGRRVESFDVKTNAVVPAVNLARWTAIAVGSTDLSTTHRLRAAGGSPLLTTDQADTLVEAFAVLQALRLRYQVVQLRRGRRATDVFTLAEVSPIDRSVLAQAVREIAEAQRRIGALVETTPPSLWSAGVTPAP
ncbi:putative nucleotidyltransferase substrate binding domain-containing protein [Jatrophihabitans sp. YIM 134969]